MGRFDGQDVGIANQQRRGVSAVDQFQAPGSGVADDDGGDEVVGAQVAREAALDPADDVEEVQLATELPAAVLARTLGIDITVAVKWQRAAAGDWGAYAAEISRRKKDS
jgi:hypothetical protein